MKIKHDSRYFSKSIIIKYLEKKIIKYNDKIVFLIKDYENNSNHRSDIVEDLRYTQWNSYLRVYKKLLKKVKPEESIWRGINKRRILINEQKNK